MNLDGEPIWSPIKDNDLKFAVNTNWDLFEHEPTKTFYLRNEKSWLQGHRPRGTVDTGRHAAGELREAAGRRQLEGREGVAARAEARRGRCAQGVRQHDAGRADPADGAPKYEPVAGHVAALGQQHRERRVPARQDGCCLLPRVRAAGSRLPASTARGRSRRRACPRTSRRSRLEHPRSRVLASVPGTQQAAEAVLLAQVPADRARQQERAQGARGGVPGRAASSSRSRRPRVAHAVNTDKDIIKVGDLYYMCFQGVWFVSQVADRPVGGRLLGAEGDLRDPGELAGAQRHLRDGRRGRRRRRVGDVRHGGGLHRA